MHNSIRLNFLVMFSAKTSGFLKDGKDVWIAEAVVLGKVIVKVTPASNITSKEAVLELIKSLATDFSVQH